MIDDLELAPLPQLGAVYHVEISATNGDFGKNPVRCTGDVWIPSVVPGGKVDTLAWAGAWAADWNVVRACGTAA